MKKSLFLFVMMVIVSIPAFAVTEIYFDLNKKQYSYEDLVKPEKTVLFVWTTWCPSCRGELKNIIQDPSLIDGINVIFLSIGEPSDDVRKTLDRLKMQPELRDKVRLDPFENITNHFYVSGVPTVVYYKNGVPIRTAHSISRDILSYVYPQEQAPVPGVGNVVTKKEPIGNIIVVDDEKRF